MRKGFTLAELLIALVVLGVIAAFSIPKVLIANQNQKWNAIAKETMGSISVAYAVYTQKNGPAPTTMTASGLIPYLNYVTIDSGVGSIDTDPTHPPGSTWPCWASEPCLHLHNGAVLFMRQPSFSGNANNNAVSFIMDQDGTVSGNGDSLWIFLYYNGRVTTMGNALLNTTDSQFSSYGGNDPGWFGWK